MEGGGQGRLQVVNSEHCRFECDEDWTSKDPGPRLFHLFLVSAPSCQEENMRSLSWAVKMADVELR